MPSLTVAEQYENYLPVLPGQKCQIAPRMDWTEQEKWSWKQICEGRAADLNQRDGHILDPNKPDNWAKQRILRSQFLESILLNEPYKAALTRRGVMITGAWFPEVIDLSEATLTKPLALNGCRFDEEMILSHLETHHWISLGGSVFNRTLSMHRLQVGGSLRMNKGARFQKIYLSGAIIGDVLDLQNSTFADDLDMNSLQVGTNLLMDGPSSFQSVSLSGAKIGGEISTNGSTFHSLFFMSGLQTHGSFFLEMASFAQVDLRGSRIGGQLVMVGSSFAGRLDMGGIRVGDELILRRAEFTSGEEIHLTFAKIESNLDISDSSLPSLNLTGTQIKGELRLGSNNSPPVRWHEDANLILRNTEVQSVQDLREAWPDKLVLDGFTYNHLGGLAGDGTNDLSKRKVSWFSQWLAKQQSYSPQPYEQLAAVLQKHGQAQKAAAILYENKERERTEVATRLSWLWLTLLNIFVGHGYKTISRITLWILVFTGIGTIMLRISRHNPFISVFGNIPVVIPRPLYKHLPPYIASKIERYLPLIAYSFDRFLPLIRLRDYQSTKPELQGWLVYYFYFHQLMGFFLASLLIASIAGLTAK